MADTLRILGQVVPTANVLTDLYTVPVATMTSVSSFVVCNQAGTNVSFSVSVAVNGESDNPKQYIYYLVFLDPNDTFTATLGISLASGDVFRVESDTAGVSFNLFGVEVS